MRDRLSEFGDTAVVVITFSRPSTVAAAQAARYRPLAVLVDPDRAVYRSYGLGRGSRRKVFGPRVLWAYAKLMRRGGRLARPGEDPLQLGGDFVIGRDGTIIFAFRSADPVDRPAVDDLLGVVHAS